MDECIVRKVVQFWVTRDDVNLYDDDTYRMNAVITGIVKDALAADALNGAQAIIAINVRKGMLRTKKKVAWSKRPYDHSLLNV